MDRKNFDGGSVPDWFTVAEKHILFQNDCLENPGQQSYQFTSSQIQDALVHILQSEIVVIATYTEPNGSKYIWNIIVDPTSGNILSNK